MQKENETKKEVWKKILTFLVKLIELVIATFFGVMTYNAVM